MDKEEFAIVSKHLSQFDLHFRTRGVRLVGAKDYGAVTRVLEEGACAVRLYDHTYFS